jgi:uncharacterized protein YbbC (DUF1343 family)
VEGPVLEPEHASFVGMHPIPVRHGCTMGELSRLFHRQFGVGEAPHVVQVSGWRRADYWCDTGLPWVLPSPGMPTPDTALVYPGTCLIEGTNASEGRGTARPFEFFGAPWLDTEALAERLHGAGLPGVRFRACHFQPSASKHAGEVCHGAQLHVLDRDAFRPVLAGFVILQALRQLGGEAFAWRRSAEGRYPVDRLAGTSALREAVDAGESPQEVAARWAEESREFERQKAAVELYR